MSKVLSATRMVFTGKPIFAKSVRRYRPGQCIVVFGGVGSYVLEETGLPVPVMKPEEASI